MPMVSAIAAHASSVSQVGRMAVLLAGIAEAALAAAIGTSLGRRPASSARQKPAVSSARFPIRARQDAVAPKAGFEIG
jgi:hypothetical protein